MKRWWTTITAGGRFASASPRVCGASRWRRVEEAIRARERGDELCRLDLSNEAIRVARLLLRLLPDRPEVGGLLALMLLTDARRPARTGALTAS